MVMKNSVETQENRHHTVGADDANIIIGKGI